MDGKEDIDGDTKKSNVFSEQSLMRMIGLEVEKEIFWIPRDTLALYSPVFEKMFYGKFAESDKVIIPLPDKKADDILEFLQCLIPMPTQKKINDDNIDVVLSLADEYQVDELINRANDYLLIKVLGELGGEEFNADQTEKLLKILMIGSKYRMRELLLKCIPKCSSIDSQKLQPLFAELRSEVINCLLLQRCQLRSDDLMHTVSKYYGVNQANYCSLHQQKFSLRCSRCCELFCQQCPTSVCDRGISGFEKIEETMRGLLARMK